MAKKEKTIQIAELENFIVYAALKCYRSMTVAAPDYFIDTNTGENVGQNIDLVIYPDGTKEPMHYKICVAGTNRLIDID
jgi:hypothetical protein